MPDLPYPDAAVDLSALDLTPEIDETAWVATGAVVIGRVSIGHHSSVWYGCVIRGDTDRIEIGDETNIQDGSILHCDPGQPCLIGNRVTLGHRAIVHASVVEDDALIGMSATVLSRCHIGAGALIAGGSLVREGITVPPRTLWAGSPARQIKELSPQQSEHMQHIYRHYVNAATVYKHHENVD